MVQYMAVMTLALEVAAQLWETRERQRAERDERAAAVLHAELRTRYAKDRLEWEPLLDPARRDAVSEQAAAKAWCTAQSWRGYPDAETVARVTEEKARAYAPDLMRAYDQLRADGVDPPSPWARPSPESAAATATATPPDPQAAARAGALAWRGRTRPRRP